MSPSKTSPSVEGSETVIEFAVRERLTKDQIADLLTSLGGQRQGSREEVADRLLAIKGLKVRDVLAKLPTDDLRVIIRRFDVPEAPRPAGLLGFAASALGDERSSLTKRIEAFAETQRGSGALKPSPTSDQPAASPRARPVRPTPIPAAPDQRTEPPPPPPPVAPPPTSTPPTPVAPSGAQAGLPAFQETRDFVGSYKFAYQWDAEDLYEAELLGALRGRFGANNAVRQQGESGRVYDIVVRNSARVEVKVPKQKTDLDRMSGQVRRYLAQHPGGVIVVIVGFMMRNQQEIHNAQADLESAGAVVFQK